MWLIFINENKLHQQSAAYYSPPPLSDARIDLIIILVQFEVKSCLYLNHSTSLYGIFRQYKIKSIYNFSIANHILYKL